MTRVVAVADLHGHLPLDLPEGDLLVIAGDVCPLADHSVPFQAAWLEESFYPWMDALPHAEVVWIAGNHDFACQDGDWRPGGRGAYLLDSGTEVAGLSIHGTPWVPNLKRWAFYADDEARREKFGLIPRVDILVSHGPPRGTGDRLVGGTEIGCRFLAERLLAAPPRLCVFGHIHEGYGLWRRGEATLANVAYVDELYEVRPNAARVFELEAAGEPVKVL
jgi:Icc-related predicted phosphoesterase